MFVDDIKQGVTSTQCCGSIPNTLNLDPDSVFRPNLDPDLVPGPDPDPGKQMLRQDPNFFFISIWYYIGTG